MKCFNNPRLLVSISGEYLTGGIVSSSCVAKITWVFYIFQLFEVMMRNSFMKMHGAFYLLECNAAECVVIWTFYLE